ncbi:hypothetical protein AB1N83_012064 [Pleurotus pulmonarius]
MGTSGYKVYRHRGRFYTQYVSHDAYHSGLGLELMHSVPREPKEYAEWIAERRKFFDQVQAHVVDGKHPDYTITRAAPKFDDFICYIYEIDLDHHTYHYGGFPMFRLDNLPPDEIFEESIGADGFGHPMPTDALPEEHMYRRRAVLPPQPLDIEAYEAYREPTGKIDALQATLDAHSTPSTAQESCARLYEVIVSAFMSNYALHSALCSSELNCDDAEDAASIPGFVEKAALKFLLVAFLPMDYHVYYVDGLDKSYIDEQYEKRKAQYMWIFYDLCAKAVVGPLDQESVLQGAVGDLVRHIHGTGKQGVVYGVLCSLFHVVIVRVDMANGGRFEHTPALTFLPPRRGNGPWAQGLDAVMKLSLHLQPSIFDLDVDPRGAAPPASSHAPTYFDRLPYEIVQQIVGDLEYERYTSSPDGLIALGSLGAQTQQAVSPYVFCARVGGYPLGAAVGAKVGWYARWRWVSELFRDHLGRCMLHRRERCGLYVGPGDPRHLGTLVFNVGRVGALTVTACHITLGEFQRLR